MRDEIGKDIIEDQEEYYVIILEMRGSRPVLDPSSKKRYKTEYYTYLGYFQADRYQAYGDRLRIASCPQNARQWRTIKGATKALSGLLEKETIKPKHNAKVCRFVTHRLSRLDVVEAGDPQPDATGDLSHA